MTDVFDPLKRSEVMSKIRSRNTSPELFVRRLLFAAGFRYRLCSGKLPGRPDIVLSKWRVVIFVNGCFWHSHRGCRRSVMPKTNVEFWQRKLQKNVARDVENFEQLKLLGWRVLVVWECGCRNSLKKRLAAELENFIRSEVGIPFMEIGREQLESERPTGDSRDRRESQGEDV